MDLRVRDVVANIRHKGKATDEQIDDRPVICKTRFKLGHDTCGQRSCIECFDIKMVDLEREDDTAQEYYDNYEEENEERGCHNCDGQNCGDCDDEYEGWVRD